MSTMTRQDLLNVTEIAKDKIIERLVTKYDVQVACDNARDRILSSVQSMNMENQGMIRHINAQKDQSWRKIVALESQIAGLQQEIRAMRFTLNRFLDTLESPKSVQSSDWDLSSLPLK